MIVVARGMVNTVMNVAGIGKNHVAALHPIHALTVQKRYVSRNVDVYFKIRMNMRWIKARTLNVAVLADV
jgi:hypothetical protein